MQEDQRFKNALEELRPYYKAFEKSKSGPDPIKTKKALALTISVAEADLSAAFRLLTDKETGRLLTADRLITILNNFSTTFSISSDGLLVETGRKVTREEKITPFQDFKNAKIIDKITTGSSEIWHLNTYLAPNLSGQDHDNSAIKSWLRMGRQVRILLLRPDGKALRLRAKTNLMGDLQNDPTRARQTLAHTLEYGTDVLYQLQKDYPGQLQVRLMDEIPGVNCFILPDKIYLGFHLSTGHSESSPCWEISNPKSGSYIALKEHYESLWNNKARSQPLTEQLYQRIKASLKMYNANVESFEGSWLLSLHDTTEEMVNNGSITGSVAEWEILIKKVADNSIYPEATLKIDDIEFTGNLIVEQFRDQTYAHVRFTDFKTLSFHLSFSTIQGGEGRPIYGFFILTNRSDASAGLAILKNKNEISKGETYEAAIDRLLKFADGAYMNLTRIRNNMNEFISYDEHLFPVRGLFKVYSYGGKRGEEKYIKVNWLEIDNSGIVRYKNQQFGNEMNNVLEGRATLIGPNLHIVFTASRPRKRRSYLIIGIHDIVTGDDLYYSGVHLGVSWDTQMPHGKRFILQSVKNTKFEQNSPNLILLHSKEYKALPEGLRQLLSGRVKNLLGFLRTEGRISNSGHIIKEWRDSFKLNDVFLDSALMHLYRDDIAGCATMLLRAVNHGFDRLDLFKEKAIEMGKEDHLVGLRTHPDYLSIETVYKLNI